MSQYRQFVSAHGRAQVAVYFLVACLVFLTIDLLLNFVLVVLNSNFDDANALGILIDANSILLLLLYLGSAVWFLIWLHRAYENLEALSVMRPQYTPGWAVGWFFIPFANLVMPYKILDEVWVKSDPLLNQPGNESWQQPGSSGLLGWWWGFWVVGGIADRIMTGVSGDAETPDQLFLWAKVGIVIDALFIIAGFFAILVVRGIDKRQEARIKSATDLGGPPPPPMFGNQES
jgi:hypothetical protein